MAAYHGRGDILSGPGAARLRSHLRRSHRQSRSSRGRLRAKPTCPASRPSSPRTPNCYRNCYKSAALSSPDLQAPPTLEGLRVLLDLGHPRRSALARRRSLVRHAKELHGPALRRMARLARHRPRAHRARRARQCYRRTRPHPSPARRQSLHRRLLEAPPPTRLRRRPPRCRSHHAGHRTPTATTPSTRCLMSS